MLLFCVFERAREREWESVKEREEESGGLWEGLPCLQTGISVLASHAEFQLKVKQKPDPGKRAHTNKHTHAYTLGCIHQRKDNEQNKKHRQKRYDTQSW